MQKAGHGRINENARLLSCCKLNSFKAAVSADDIVCLSF